jgi:hypothetical protein
MPGNRYGEMPKKRGYGDRDGGRPTLIESLKVTLVIRAALKSKVNIFNQAVLFLFFSSPSPLPPFFISTLFGNQRTTSTAIYHCLIPLLFHPSHAWGKISYSLSFE